MNQLSGESRSIVSSEAGTTRDYIDLNIEYNGVLITLIDTAGIRNTENSIEKEGIEKIRELANTADGYILIEDATDKTSAEIPSFFNSKKPILKVKNKSDLITIDKKKTNVTYTSCKTGHGLQELKENLVSTFFDRNQYEPELMLCNIRQIAALKKAYQYIKTSKQLIEKKTSLDIISIELRDAIDQLSDIMGDTFTEELLDGIFSKFCIGK